MPRRPFAAAVLLAVATLPIAGCGQVEDINKQAVGAITDALVNAGQAIAEASQVYYLRSLGPFAVASAVGNSAPSGGWGAISALSTDAAFRTLLTPEDSNQPPPSIFGLDKSNPPGERQ